MLFVLAVLALAQDQAPPTSPPAAEEIIHPDWLDRPTGKDVARVYPDGATRRNINGFAALDCAAASDGRLHNCEVEAESPHGEGFGEAALKLVPDFRLKPTRPSGESVEGGTVRIPLRFVVSSSVDQQRKTRASAASAAEARACYGQVAHLAQRSPNAENAWRGTAFWSIQLAIAMAPDYPPSEYEYALSSSRRMAAMGRLDPPAGADLAACLAKVPKG
jgi:TonB family protein